MKQVNRHKLIPIGIICGIVCIGIVYFNLFYLTFRHVNFKPTKKICKTSGCIKAADDIINSIDENTNPCEDFHQFACGHWKRTGYYTRRLFEISDVVTNELKAIMTDIVNATSNATANEPHYQTLMRKYYQQCLVNYNHTQEYEVFKSQIKSFGGWPVVEGENWSNDSFNWIDMLIKFRKAGFPAGLLLDITTETRDPSYVSITVGSLGMPSGDEEDIEERIEKYTKYLVEWAIGMGGDNETVRSEIEAVVQFEKKIKQLSSSKKTNNQYNLTGLRELNLSFDMERILRSLLNENITESDTFAIESEEYLTKLDGLLNETDARIVANFLIARVVKCANETWSIYYGDRPANTDENCLAYIKSTWNLLGIPLATMHVRKHVDNETIMQVGEIFASVQDTIVSKLKNVEWLDESSKHDVIEKAANVRVHVGYMKEILNDTFLEEIFKGFDFPDNITGYEMSLLLRKHLIYLSLKDWKVKIGNYPVAVTATFVNAYYMTQYNEVHICEAFLRGLIFDKDKPRYINYGPATRYASHEIFHGFDTDGINYDKHGYHKKLFHQNETLEEFKNRTKCISSQYGAAFKKDGLSPKVNSSKTIDNDIVDISGIKYAYLAYQKWVEDFGYELPLPGLNYTPDQLFFISLGIGYCEDFGTVEAMSNYYADGYHSPEKYRVNGMMQNSPFFADAFKCKQGSPMNPVNKCEVW